ncbi:MAG: ABC transporter permease [Rhodospirillaceae bacterium]|nr:ABC transporter permease [Rhodospirillaceae bacterium]
MTTLATRPGRASSALDLLVPMAVIVRWRTALWQFLLRAIARRYRASAFGLVWMMIVPLATLAIYTFVFGVVLQSRWDNPGSAEIPFSLNLFAGLLVFWIMADGLAQAMGAVVAHTNLVKRALFPLEIMPVVTIVDSAFHGLINTVILLAAVLALGGQVPPTAALFPLVMIPFLVLLVGLAWIVAALGVFFRDLGQVIGLLMTGALFMSPVFYAVDRLSPGLQTAISFNPVSLIVVQARHVLLEGRMPDWTALALYLAVAWAVMALGLAFFRRARATFADVL